MPIAKGIPPLEKRVVLAALVFAAAQLALIAFAAYKLGVTVPTCVPTKPFTNGEIITVGPGRYEAHVMAKMWSFEPDTITVPKGSVVDFYVTSADVAHGFYIRGTNVNLMALPNTLNYAQARFDTPGKYQIVCHEYCGAGHQEMAATLEVTP